MLARVCVCVQALDWCIHTATFLSTTDMLGSMQQNSHHNDSNSTYSGHQQVKLQMDQFLDSYTPPSEEEVEQLRQLMENIENSQWIKDNATFAYHRVLEVKERLACYTRLLDQEQLERQCTHEAAEAAAQAGPQHKEDGEGGDELDGVLIDDNVVLQTWDSEEDLLGGGCVTLRHPRVMAGQGSSLHYDNIGPGQAMKLLQTVAQNADAKLMPQPMHGEWGWVIELLVQWLLDLTLFLPLLI